MYEYSWIDPTSLNTFAAEGFRVVPGTTRPMSASRPNGAILMEREVISELDFDGRLEFNGQLVDNKQLSDLISTGWITVEYKGYYGRVDGLNRHAVDLILKEKNV